MEAKIINTTTTTVPISRVLKKTAQTYCKANGESFSAYVRRLIREDLKKQGRTVTITTKVI